jgi:hypothetical protein
MYSQYGRRAQAVGVVRDAQALAPDRDRALEIAAQVVREREVVVDVLLERVDVDAARVGHTRRLRFVRPVRDELRRALEIRQRAIEVAHADEAMTAEAPHPRIVGMFRDALGEDRDRLLEAREVSEAPAVPDQRLRVVGCQIVGRLRFRELRFALRSLRRLERRGYSAAPCNETPARPEAALASSWKQHKRRAGHFRRPASERSCRVG